MTARRTPGISDAQLRSALTRLPDSQRMAADLASIVATVERSPQRRSLPTWVPSGAARLMKVAVLVGTIAVLVALLVALAIIVGSQRRLPPPLGIAKPGLIAFDLNGTIWTANPDGTGRRRLTSGPSDGGETFSPDGTEIAYAAAARDMSTSLIVMDADGGHPRTVAEHLAEVGDIVWSPDSRRVAFSGHILDESGFHLFTAAVDHPAPSDSGGLTSSGWSLPGPRTAETSLSSTSTMSTIPPTALAPCG